MQCGKSISCKRCEHRYAKNKCRLGLTKGKKMLRDSLCWTCERSANPDESMCCIWDRSKGTIPVPDSKWHSKMIDSARQPRTELRTIYECPEYVQMERLKGAVKDEK